MALRGDFSSQCWVPFLLGVSDRDVLLFYSYGCQTNYLLFYQSFEEKLVMKHETIYILRLITSILNLFFYYIFRYLHKYG